MAEITEKGKPFSNIVKDIARRFWRHENAALAMVLIILIGVAAVLSKGLTIRPDNMINILFASAIRGVASVGQAFVILTAGIDISIGGIGLFCGVLGAGMMTAAPDLNIVGYPVSIYIALPIMLLTGASWGAINGSLVSRIGIPALIVTLGMWQITTGVAFYITHGQNFYLLPENLAFFGQGRVGGVPVPVIIFIVVVAVVYFVLNYTTFGRSVYATGGNPVSAWLSGIRVKNIRFLVYVISGFLAGLSAIIMTARMRSASMRTLSGLELDTIAAVCVGGVSLFGGRGSIIGVVIGVLIIGVINNALSVLGIPYIVQRVVKGVIIITAVAADIMRRRGR